MFSNPSTSPPLTEALTSPGQKTAKSKLLRLLSHGQKLEEEEEEEKKERKETKKNKKRFVEGEKERDGRGGSATIVVSA